jgi:riboflavin kinase/FMN adenylyltransferase
LKIFNSIHDFDSFKKTIITVGTFDGVHVGHAKILEKLTQDTRNSDYESLVLTFFPHPRMVLKSQSEIKLLNTIDEKIVLLTKMGIDNLVIHPFDEKFSELTAEEFVKKVLINQFNIHKIIIGHDHRFGRDRVATINDLIIFGTEHNFEVEQISVQEIDAVSISSTKIRNALREGNMDLANEFLGYEYFITGIVTKGKQLGRTIGFPTANIQLEEEYKLIPKNGVYIVKSKLNHETVFGIMNIGYNPTLEGKNLSIEVYFMNFEGDLYGQKIQISILQYLRPEQKFDSIALLQQQLEQDKQSAVDYIKVL